MKNTFVIGLFMLIVVGAGCSKKDNLTDKGKEIALTISPGINNPRNSEGDFVTLKDGRILFVYTRFTGFSSDDHGPAFLAGRFSSDSGKTWTKTDETVVVPEIGPNIMSVSLLRLKNGTIALFYIRKNSLYDCIPMVRFSNDEAKTWSPAAPCITDKKGYFVLNNNRIIQLESGRLILPVSLHYLAGEAAWQDRGRLMVYFSDDNGQTWKSSKQVPNPGNIIIQEPGVVALKNGDLLMLMRTTNNVQYISRSSDKGETWKAIAPSTIKSPLAPASIARIPSTNDLLLVWNNNGGDNEAIRGRRTPFTLAVSSDEADTWGGVRTIEDNPDGWYCYTAIHFMGKYVLLAHSAGNVSKGTQQSVIRITRLTTEWVYNKGAR